MGGVQGTFCFRTPSGEGGEGSGGRRWVIIVKKVLHGGLHPKVQPLTILLYAIFDRKGTPLEYLLMTKINGTPRPFTYMYQV